MTQTATKLAAGTPCWVDLSSDDLEASIGFYSELFGWEAEAAGPAEQTGGYMIFNLNGKMVAAAMKKMDSNTPTVWTTYMKTDNADETAEKVKQAGGSVMFEPMDVMEAGRMAVFTDTSGAVFSVWQPRNHPGGEVFNVPGALSWNELTTRDADGAKKFYSTVFGWEAEDHEMGPMTYTEWKLNGNSISGMIEMLPAEMPPFWAVYFAVADCDASVAKVEQLGGKVMRPPMDIPAGRFAFVSDPQGGMFAVIALANPPG